MRTHLYEKLTATRKAMLTAISDGAVYGTRDVYNKLNGEHTFNAVSTCFSGMARADLVECVNGPMSAGRLGRYRITGRGFDLLHDKQVRRIARGDFSAIEKQWEPKPQVQPAAQDVQVMSEYDANLFDQVSIRYDEIIADLLARIEALEELATKPAPEPVLLLTPAPKERKPSVFLGGAKPSQGFMIAKEFREQFDVRCVSSDDLNKWRSMAKNCDYVLAMQPFISHKHTETLQSAGKDIVYVHSMTDIRDTLTKLYVEGE